MNIIQNNLLSGYRNTGFNVSSIGGTPVANSSYWSSLGNGSTASALGGLQYNPVQMAAGNATTQAASGGGSAIPWGSVAQIAASLISNTASVYMENQVAKAKASAYRSQARMVQQAAVQKNKYLNEEIGQQVWNIYDQSRALEGQQITAMGTSGFTDVSAGDKRLLRDTRLKTEAAVEGLNRSAFLQQFETNRAAAMEASRLEYAAKMQDRIRKSTSGWKAVGRVLADTTLDAAGMYFGGKATGNGSGLNINVFGSAK